MKYSVTIVFYRKLLLISLLVFSKLCFSDELKIRSLPYPHSHVISFASDTDMQLPNWGAGFHHLVNEKMGLPISDSMWVHGTPPGTQSMLFMGKDFNRTATDINNHTVFGLLIRQWHRGNIDHFHSWQNDGTYRILNTFSKGVNLNSAVVKINIPEAPVELLSGTFKNIRFVFNKTPPTDMNIVLLDKNKEKAIVMSNAILSAQKAFPSESNYSVKGNAIDLFLDESLDPNIILSSKNFNLASLQAVELHFPSHKENCEIVLERIERDNFSRQSLLKQASFLHKFNIRPLYLSGHGGFTFSQNPAYPINHKVVLPPTKGTIWENPQIDRTLEVGAMNLNSHAYHHDVLYNLGIETMWNFEAGLGHHNTYQESPVLSEFPGFPYYLFSRTTQKGVHVDSAEGYTNSLKKNYPQLKNLDDNLIKNFYLGNTALSQSEQGGFLGVLIALGLSQIDAGEKVEHFWYTHFGTIAHHSALGLTSQKPLTPAIETCLKNLANYYYNFTGSIPLNHRVWVAPATVYSHYRLVQTELQSHITYQNNIIYIHHWLSPVTKRIMAGVGSRTRDLHGVTFYVDKPEEIDVRIDGQSVKSFTQNPPDETGKSSITLVDDSHPTVLLGKISLLDKIESSGAKYSELASLAGDRVNSIIKASEPGTVFVTYKPENIELWNTTHLHFSFKKVIRNNPNVRFFIELTREDGQKILVQENDRKDNFPLSKVNAFWLFNPIENEKNGDFVFKTLAQDQLNWNSSMLHSQNSFESNPLLIGKIKEIRIGMLNANIDDEIQVGRVVALRPAANGNSPDHSKLVMGRITNRSSASVSNTVVTMEIQGQILTTSTDSDGYYAFYEVTKGSVVKLYIMQEGKKIVPIQGVQLEVVKDEAEIDFVIN